VLNPTAVPLYGSDYWPVEILSSDIAVKEALALSNALSSFDTTIMDSRVDVYVDSSRYFMPGTANPLGPMPCRSR